MSAIRLPTQIWPTRIWLGTPSGTPWWSQLAAYVRAERAKPVAEPERSPAADVGSRRRILIAQGLDGRWRVGGEGYATGPDFALLSQAVGLITKYPQADVHIDGYTDSFGKPDYNVTLSQQRAAAVQAWLRERIAQEAYKFHSQGHGSSDYVVSAQGSIEQQQPNRRVEILIQALKQ